MFDIGVVVCPDFQVFDLACCGPFELANNVAMKSLYGVTLLSRDGGAIRTAVGLTVQTERLGRRAFDTLIIASNANVELDSFLVRYLRKVGPATRRVSAISSSIQILAAAGLLEGRRATTHWRQAMEFKRQYPNIKIEEDQIFVKDGNIWSSAGMSACIDLSLAMVEEDMGGNFARIVAKHLLHQRRVGVKSQFFAMSEVRAKTTRIQATLDYVKDNLRTEISVEDIARIAGLSTRQFARVFHEETGRTPAKAIEILRLESARLLLETGRGTVESVAKATGFGDRERMRRAFIRVFGQPPSTVQRASTNSP